MNETVTTRRAVLFGAGTLTLSTCVATPVAMATEDPIIALVDRYNALWPLCPGDEDEAGNIRWNPEITRLEAEIAETMPTTRAGALATVRFVAVSRRR